MSVVGNLLVVFVLFRFKQTRSSVNLFIGNMAVADLLSTVCLSWASLTESLFQNYPNGPFICQYGDFFKYTCLLASTFSLLVLSADRLIKIIRPFRKTLTTRQTVLWCIIIWVVAFAISSPHAAWKRLGVRAWKDNYLEVWCAETITSGRKTLSYWIALLAVTCYIPVIFMVVFYSAVICKMDKFSRRLNDSGNPVKGIYRKRILQMIFVYLLVSLVCWAPMTLCVFYKALYHDKAEDRLLPNWFQNVKFTQHVLACVNAAINPLIYGVVNETFRKAIVLQFPCLSKCINKFGWNSPNSRHTHRNTIRVNQFPATSHGEEGSSSPASMYSLKIVTPSLRVLNRRKSSSSMLNSEFVIHSIESLEVSTEVSTEVSRNSQFEVDRL